MVHHLLRILRLGAVAASLGLCAAHAQPEESIAFFEKKVRPIFAARCFSCHGEKAQMASLKLTTAAGFWKGADSGPVVARDDPDKSRLLQVVRYSEKIKMPPDGKLKEEEIRALEAWVKMGAPWPAEAAGHPAGSPSKAVFSQEKIDHWAFRPVRDSSPPPVEDQAWAQSPIDHFILARLEEKGLTPAPPAGKLTLLRRAKFDLHGLPPSLEEIKEFLSDESPEAFSRLVDRLLASPLYGERWGRHWLDVARYADSTGVDEDKPYVHAWRYRDYVIDAFNQDLPYDRFITEQIAGDLIPAANAGEINERGIIATGFLALGPKALAQRDMMKKIYDVVDEQIDTVSKAFLGLTIACARCHDHKFDPILTRDYYSLASIFASTRTYTNPEAPDSTFHVEPLVSKDIHDRYQEHQRRIQAAKSQIRALEMLAGLQHMKDRMLPHLADYMTAARSVYEGGAHTEEAAGSRRLDAAVLKKWVEYLRPGKEHRVFLDEWNAARGDRIRAAASRYQERFAGTLAKRYDAVAEWQEKMDAAAEAGTEPPRAPEFNPLDDLFYSDVTSEDDSPFSLGRKEREQALPEAAKNRVAVLRERVKALEAQSPAEPPMACAVAEGKAIEQRVFIRGNYDHHGEPAPKQFPEILAGAEQQPVREGSGRRELAAWLTRSDNPLPSRVMMNRIWQWHFGEALVRTPNNFGTVGERPTHPELLDFLARRFVETGWSVKTMHRLIMQSSTYRMSSQVSDSAWAKDAGNQLWSRFERRRLSLEEVRDTLLKVSGSLDAAIGGTLEPGAGSFTEFQRNNRRVNPDEHHRRTVYLPLYRNKLPTTLGLFDFPDSTTSWASRTETNIAPQALYFMNSEFVAGRVEHFAKRLLAEASIDDSARIRGAYLTLFTREPKTAEVQSARDYLGAFRQRRAQDPHAGEAAWSSLCKVLMMSNEFHYVD